MGYVGLLVVMEAKPGKEGDLARFLEGALPLVEREPATTNWFAVRLGPTKFAIFDTFSDNAGRDAHLAGEVAAALMEKAPELLAQAPNIERADVLAEKVGG
ncbi:MAG: antibiotic biosynthesis monooxygenase [Betaproteobacteria bacterium 13_1_20CM_3_63_8]|nr:MAG: antibiotic biosynthesis monooxygenase [Betaproteobacteria bacterium 13_1_20CM_3_63_8]